MNSTEKHKSKAAIESARKTARPVRPPDRFLVFGAPVIEEEDIAEVVDSLRKRWIGTGPKVARFERDFAALKQKKNAMALHSCTAALHLAMLACGLRPGDEVITTAMTFCATVNAIIHAGATPVLVDCDRQTFNISPEKIEKSISSRTKAIIVVHFAGRICQMEAIMEIARRYDLMVIEDCAHAIESESRGVKSGCFGDIGCFSFYVTKNITTGEGGMLITDNDRIAERVKMLGLHGMSKDAWRRFSDTGYKHYEIIHGGYKYNMMDIQAAIGIHQLKRIDTCWRKRKAVWQIYDNAFQDLPCTLPPPPEPATTHAYHLYTPLLDIEALGKPRDEVLSALTAENIGVGVHYIPVHRHPFYRKMFGWQKGDFPNAEWVGDRTLSLPLSAALENQDVEDVCNAFKKVLGK